MEQKPLVSIVTPCHNSSAFIHRLLDSIIEQTYPRIEMITVDNDSKDNTAEIIHSYMPKFQERGYTLIYIHQEDLGPSAGIQTGIRHIQGDYLVMPDSDDWYAKSTSIEIFVNKFEDLPDYYAVLRSQMQLINEQDMSPMEIIYKGFPEDDPGTLFVDCLYGQNGYNFAPINYMVKVSKFKEMTGLEIFNAYNTGQQRQICLPLYYKYKAWTIADVLVCYLVRSNSVSHGDYAKYSTQKKLYNQSPEYIDSILSCIDVMPEHKRMHYRNSFLQMQTIFILKMAISSGNKDDISTYLDNYAKYGGNSKKLLFSLKKEKLIARIKAMIYKILFFWK